MEENQLVENQVVAFISWDGYGASTRKIALERSKIHIGRYRGDRIYSECQTRSSRRGYASGFYKVFTGKVFSDRICQHCHMRDPLFWARQQAGATVVEKEKAEPQVETPVCGCNQKLKDGDLVGFVGWHYYDYKTRTLKNGKIHVGRYRGSDESIRSVCQTHASYHGPFSRSQHKIIRAEKDNRRYCKFCRDRYPGIYGKLSITVAPPEMAYYLVYPRRDQHGNKLNGYEVITTTDKASMERQLKSRPEVLKALRTGVVTGLNISNVKLFKGFSVDINYKMREVIDRVEIKE